MNLKDLVIREKQSKTSNSFLVGINSQGMKNYHLS